MPNQEQKTSGYQEEEQASGQQEELRQKYIDREKYRDKVITGGLAVSFGGVIIGAGAAVLTADSNPDIRTIAAKVAVLGGCAALGGLVSTAGAFFIPKVKVPDTVKTELVGEDKINNVSAKAAPKAPQYGTPVYKDEYGSYRVVTEDPQRRPIIVFRDKNIVRHDGNVKRTVYCYGPSFSNKSKVVTEDELRHRNEELQGTMIIGEPVMSLDPNGNPVTSRVEVADENEKIHSVEGSVWYAVEGGNEAICGNFRKTFVPPVEPTIGLG